LPNLEKLVELGFVSEGGASEEGAPATYSLTDLGHRARKYAQIAESSSLR
jgi:DNA-binding PadR family transcriptional regulator